MESRTGIRAGFGQFPAVRGCVSGASIAQAMRDKPKTIIEVIIGEIMNT